MKTTLNALFTALGLVAGVAAPVLAQGTAFTYQGRLNDGTNTANGLYDLTFALYDTNQRAGNLIAGPLTNSATAVSNGLFMIMLDFGNPFDGTPRWLEIGVRTNAGNAFATLVPRQPLSPTPYAITAGSVVSGGLGAGTYDNAVTLDNADNYITGTFTGDGSYLLNVNAGSLNGLAATNLWQLGGNNIMPGEFIGSTNDQPVEIWVNNQRALHIESTTNSPNVIGGWSNNFAAPGVVMGTIGGGGGQSVINGTWFTNSLLSVYATVGGGLGNQAGNTNGDPSLSRGATVGGGGLNTAAGQYSTVPGGYNNYAAGTDSFAAGSYAEANYNGSFVWADDYFEFPFSDAGPNQFCIRAYGGVQVFGGGLAVTGSTSPNYPGTAGVYVESSSVSGIQSGYVYSWNYVSNYPMPLLLNSPGGNVGIGATSPTHLFQVGNAYCDGNTWAPASDRNSKAGFRPVDAQVVLSKVAAMPITCWHYTNDVATPHLGPMAQDFYEAFNVGADDKHISTTDEGGVALAAIQGLNQKVNELKSELDRRNEENAGLKVRLDRMERILEQGARWH